MARPKKKKIYASPDRQRQVETTKARHGKNFYKDLGNATSEFKKNPEVARYYAYRRWHGWLYDDQGELLPEYANRSLEEVIAEHKQLEEGR